MTPSQLVGLDTSCVIRLLIGEPGHLVEKAIAQLDTIAQENKLAAVSDLVVSEAYYALQYHYDVPKQLALDMLKQFLESPEIVPLNEALTVLQQSNLAKAKPGFVDRMIHADYYRNTSRMLTFEKSANKLPGVTVI